MNVDEKIEGLIQEGQGTDPNDIDLINEVKKIRENTVPKEDFEKLQAKYKQVVKDVINGVGTKQEASDTVNLEEIRKNLFTDKVEDLSNRDFWKNVLALRHERLEKEGVDIFLPKGQKTRYTREDYESANKVDEVITQMLEDSEENPQLFNVLFNGALN